MVLGIFKRKQNAGPERVEEIIVPARYVSSDAHWYDPLQGVVEFVNILQERGSFLPAELPQNAMLAYYADYYAAQVANGGHAQYVDNSGLHPVTIGYAQRGLEAVGLQPLADLHSRAIDIGKRVFEARATSKPLDALNAEIGAVDQEFFRLQQEEPRRTIAEWVMACPECRVLPDEEVKAAYEALLRPHPVRGQRNRDARIGALEARIQDSMKIAAQLLCYSAAGGGLRFQRLILGFPAPEAGEDAQIWRIATDRGERMMVYSPAVGRFTLHERSDVAQSGDGGISMSAVEGLQAESEKRGRHLTNLDLLGDRLSTVSHDDLAGALKTASSHPIAMAAQLAGDAMKFGDLLELSVMGESGEGLTMYQVHYRGREQASLAVGINRDRLRLAENTGKSWKKLVEIRLKEASSAESARRERQRTLPSPPFLSGEDSR